jgi:hypothetical protein
MSTRLLRSASLGISLLGFGLSSSCGGDSDEFSSVPNAGTGGNAGSAGALGKGGSSGTGGAGGSAGNGGSAGKGGAAGKGGSAGMTPTAGVAGEAGSPSGSGGAVEGGAPGAGTPGAGAPGTGATGGVPSVDECIEDVLGAGCRALMDCAREACDLDACLGEGYAEGDYSGGACESFINCPVDCECDETCVNEMCTPETAGDCLTCMVPQYACIQLACPGQIAGCELLSP